MTFPSVQEPLSQEQIQELHRAKAAVPALKEQIERAKIAGIDVGNLEEQLRESEMQLNKLITAYGN